MTSQLMSLAVRSWVRLWARPRALPEQLYERIRAANETPRRFYFVLATDAAADYEALQQLLRQEPWRTVGARNTSDERIICLQKWAGWLRNRLDHRLPDDLRQLVMEQFSLAANDVDAELIPVSVFWGRAPEKESSFLRVPFAVTWSDMGIVRRMLAVMFNGRSLVIQFGEPVSLRSMFGDAQDAALASRRVARICRGLLHRQRAAVIGPEIASRSNIVAQVLRAQAVRQAMRSEMRTKNLTRRQAIHAASACVKEIAANYSHTTVNVLSRLLSHVWNRLYDGVELHHLDNLRAVVEGNEVVYVPCHRSHMDYLLLSHTIYQKGYAVPHIAAGINLNMPVIGSILRQGGAFFIRRSFAGNALYTAVFTRYLGVMMARGHAIEYFIEGGRSRTGRLLQPKTGAITMTVRSFLRDPGKPVVFVPVYFGYERIVEGNTYIGELSGKPKRKESFLGVLRTIPALRERHGKVHVSIGEPIFLDPLLQQYAPQWRESVVEDKPVWLNPLVNDLSERIMRHINSAACVTPINLLALVMLATPKQAMIEVDLIRQLDLYASMLKHLPYSSLVTVTGMDGTAIVQYGEQMQLLKRQTHPLGDVISMTEEKAILATYFRNNILHLMILPSAIASCFLSNRSVRTEDIQRLAWRLYPYVRDELFLRWSEEELPAVVLDILRMLNTHGLLESLDDGATWTRPRVGSAAAVQLSMLAQISMQIIERYYLSISLLLKAGSGKISQDALEQQCFLMAQRMSLLYELNSPEFFDKSLFKNFYDLLRKRGVLGVNAEGRLTYTDMLFAVADDAQLVLHEQIRNSVLQVTHR
ncbi:MAG TPA: glycerol-3-phosphate 1-O-acyltransferase PlsB [Steroidobacteraceae bacterium]|nr:glycerol-3-phosphate 1-O-acyltransferase PlsB [Steroidobacteraceae bacterium]